MNASYYHSGGQPSTMGMKGRSSSRGSKGEAPSVVFFQRLPGCGPRDEMSWGKNNLLQLLCQKSGPEFFAKKKHMSGWNVASVSANTPRSR